MGGDEHERQRAERAVPGDHPVEPDGALDDRDAGDQEDHEQGQVGADEARPAGELDEQAPRAARAGARGDLDADDEAEADAGESDGDVARAPGAARAAGARRGRLRPSVGPRVALLMTGTLASLAVRNL